MRPSDSPDAGPAEPAATGPEGGSQFAVPGSRSVPRFGVHVWLVLTIIALDQAAKAVVLQTIPLFGHIPVVPGFLDLVHVRNAGVAFGFLNDLHVGYQKIVTTLLAVVALAGIGYYARQVKPHERLARLGLSVILGGALGNLADRLRVGYVTDFVDVYYGGWHFWAFNVADASITIGAVLVFADLLLVSRHASDSV